MRRSSRVREVFGARGIVTAFASGESAVQIGVAAWLLYETVDSRVSGKRHNIGEFDTPTIKCASHGMFATHQEKVNADLLPFLKS